MTTENRDARPWQTTQQPPLPPRETIHWDGSYAASRDVALPLASALDAPAAAAAQGHPVTEYCPTLPMTPRPMPRIPPTPAPAAGLTFSLDAGLLEAASHAGIPRATGTLLWCQGDAQVGHIPPVGHPTLLVQTVSAVVDGQDIELVPHLPTDDPLLAHMELVLQAASVAACVASRLYAEALADALAVHFLQRYAACRLAVQEGAGGLPPATLRRILAYIRAHLEDALSLAALAAVVQMSPNHFARLFKQATGRTPHRYVIECRIARAQELLAETDLPLSAIGLQAGWTDQSYFTVLFRKHVAMTPRAYRAATRRV